MILGISARQIRGEGKKKEISRVLIREFQNSIKLVSSCFGRETERCENDRKEDNRTKAIVSNFFEKKGEGERERKVRRHTCTCFVKRRVLQKKLHKRSMAGENRNFSKEHAILK